MSLPISEEGFKEIERARELLSSSLGHAVSLEETVIAIARSNEKKNARRGVFGPKDSCFYEISFKQIQFKSIDFK